MSMATALGRYFQIADNQLKAHTVATVRCPKRGCILANVLKIDGQRFLLVHAHTKAKLVKKGQPEGANATAPRELKPGLTVEVVKSLSPEALLEALRVGDITEANLEALYRHAGGNVARIAYLATKEEFQYKHSPDLFARCDHYSGYLPKSALDVARWSITVDELTEADNKP